MKLHKIYPITPVSKQMNSSLWYAPWRIVTFAMCLPVLLLALAACSDGQEGTVNDQATVNQRNETQRSVQEGTDEFAENAETMFREADQELEQIGQRIEDTGDDARTEVQDELDDLRQRRDRLRAGIDSLKTKNGEEAREMRMTLEGKVDDYKRDLRRVRLESIESKDEFVEAVRTEIQEIDEQINQLRQSVSQMDSTRATGFEGTVSEFKVQREELKTNLQDVMSSGSGEFADARAAMAEVISALRSKVDQAFDEVQDMDRRQKTAGLSGGE